MSFSKTIKFFLKGIILIFAFVGFFMLIYQIKSSTNGQNVTDIPVNNNEENKANKKSDLPTPSFLQSHPLKIYGSTYSIMYVSLYQPKSNDRRSKSYRYEYWLKPKINILFIDENKDEYKLLFDRPLRIKDFEYPNSKEDKQNCVIYEIIERDCNNDDVINLEDNVTLYISDVEGNDLLQITPDSLNVEEYTIYDNGKKLFITTSIPSKDHNIEKKHWLRKNFIFDIVSNKLIINKRVDELIEKAGNIIL